MSNQQNDAFDEAMYDRMVEQTREMQQVLDRNYDTQRDADLDAQGLEAYDTEEGDWDE